MLVSIGVQLATFMFWTDIFARTFNWNKMRSSASKMAVTDAAKSVVDDDADEIACD